MEAFEAAAQGLYQLIQALVIINHCIVYMTNSMNCEATCRPLITGVQGYVRQFAVACEE
jgi:hypothetical protein